MGPSRGDETNIVTNQDIRTNATKIVRGSQIKSTRANPFEGNMKAFIKVVVKQHVKH